MSATVKTELVQLKVNQRQAMKFKGWMNAQDIHNWIDGVFYVPEGYEHYLRRKDEYDRGNGHILDDAYSYLVLRVGNEPVRIDIGSWIVQLDAKSYEILSDLEFQQKYEVL
jgi:hypothetical protein